jgi:glycosyltransferase involved in cell wall biosynthesis
MSTGGNPVILYVIGQLKAGGFERQLYYILRTIDRGRYRPEIVVWRFRDDDTYVSHVRKLGIRLHSFPLNLSGIAKTLALRRLVFRLKPQIIHSYSFYTNFAAWWAAWGTRTIAIGSSRSQLTYEKKSCGLILGNLSARWPRDQIYNSFSAANTAPPSCTPFVPKHVVVVRNSVDLDAFRMAPFPCGSAVRIIGLGSLLPVKRWDRLLNVAARIVERRLDFVIEIVGDGPLKTSLRRQAEALGIADRVRFVGYKADVAALLACSSFLAHTSDTEGCPNVILEAMACGRAVVAMDTGDVSSLIDDGKTGFVIRPEDSDAFLDRLVKLITDPDLRRRMGEAGRIKAEREFSLGRLISETLAAYEKLGWRDDDSCYNQAKQ